MPAISKYPEINPSLSLVKILQGHLKNEKICLALYFISIDNNNPLLYYSIYGRVKQNKLTQNEQNQFPPRDKLRNKIVIQNIRKVPVPIQKEFKPQMGLLQDDTPGQLVLVIQIPNHLDNSWDNIYILIDQHLINSVNSKIKISGFILEGQPTWQNLVKSYFALMYPLLSDFAEIENNKLSYTKDVINTLEKSIVYNQQLLSEITLLKQNKDANLVEELNNIASKESKILGKEVKISNNSIDYILSYTGGIQKLKDAFIKAVKIANLISIAKNGRILIIEPEFIQVNEGPEELKNSRLSPKRVEKAGNILQRYEESAQRAQNVGKNITINSIAHHVLPKSISAPAISDSVKKYKTEILYLLDTKKSDWILLRTYFSPIASLAKSPINQPRE